MSDREVVGCYAMIPRFWEDFIEGYAELNDEDFRTLWLMLIQPNHEHDEKTNEVNKLAADICAVRAEKLGLNRTDIQGDRS